jgi:glyoxylase-like metal-dependent hydrolase (beta-lactamase superfamily II)
MNVSFQLGQARIARIEDYLGPSLETHKMFPGFRRAIWEAEQHWLAPTYFLPGGDRLRSSHHSWLVQTTRHTILIDACIGNHKQRTSPHFHMREGPWLDNLKNAGVAPEQIDFVMCTHLHADHVGWNTRLQNGRWVPTFPNARYLFSRVEFDRWDARRPDYPPNAFNENVFADSVLPVAEAGQMVLIDDGHTVDELLTVEATPGHTPGHVRIRLTSVGQEGLFCGDILHHPIQIPYPEICSSFDDDPGLALHVRLAMLEEAADRGVLLMPTHFAEPHRCRVKWNGGRFAIVWDR